MDTGTGKTPVSFAVMEWWYNQGRRKFIIVSQMNMVGGWIDEAEKFNVPLKFVRVHSHQTKEQKIRVVQGDYDVIVINYDSLRLLKDHLVAARFGGGVFDECQRLQNRSAKWTEAARELVLSIKQQRGGRLALSGTPATKNPLDLWSIFDVLDPYIMQYGTKPDPTRHPLGYGSYRSFEQAVCTKTPHPHLKGVYKYFFPPELVKKLQTRVTYHAYEAFKEDVLPWLPKQTFSNMYVDMTPGQEKLYNLMRDEMVAILTKQPFDTSPLEAQNIQPLNSWLSTHQQDAGVMKLLKEQVISTKLQAVLTMRLQQICSGHIKLDNGKTHMFEGGKADRLRTEIPKWVSLDTHNKLIIFTRFRADVVIVSKLLEELGVGFVSLTGDNSSNAQDAVKSFQNDAGIRAFVSNLQAGSTGITLTAANFVCYYSMSYNYGHQRQSEDRAHRIGQLRPVFYYNFMCRDSVERGILQNISNKKRLTQMTSRRFANMLLGKQMGMDYD